MGCILQRTQANFEDESIQRRDWLNSDQASQTGSNRTCWNIQIYDTTSWMTSKPEVIPGQKSAWGKCDSADCCPSPDFLERRFWITFVLPTTRPQTRQWFDC
jgi:hypothetical protein